MAAVDEQTWTSTYLSLLHELRAPLARLAMEAVRLQTESQLDEQLLRGIERVMRGLEQRVGDRIEALAVAAGALPLDRSPIDLVALLDATIAKIPGAQIERDVSAPVWVHADPHRLQCAIAGLLEAGSAVSQSVVRAVVRVATVGSRALLTVTTRERAPHHELCLAVAHHIATLHDGFAGMREAGPLTRFSLDLPALAARASTSRIRVLLVDDEVEQVSAIVELMRQDNVSVDYATSATQALEHLESMLPDVLVVDVQIPDMPGYELVRRARLRYPYLPVVLVTGYPPDHPAIAKTLAAGKSAYLSKPVDIVLLRELVTRAVGPR